jgi:hypothetical protein
MARRINHVSYYAVLVFAVLAGFVVHELAHWIAGEALGYDMAMSLNRAGVESGGPPAPADALIIAAAGPLFTIAQALVAAVLVFGRGAVLAYPLVFAALMMRLVATAVSAFNPNDEMRISDALGLGAWTLPVVVSLALLAPTVAASRRLNIGWRTNLVSYVVANAAITAIVFSDQLVA